MMRFPAHLRYVAERMGWLFGLIVFFMIGYFLLNGFNVERSYYLDVSTPFDRDLPFVVGMIYPYNLNLVMVILAILSIDVHDLPFYRRTAALFGLNLLIAFAFFLFLPVQILERPPIALDGSFTTSLAAFLFWLDHPTNLFPSLHVQLSVLSALVIVRQRPGLALPTTCMVVAVAASTVLLKQHYIADGALGALLAVTTWRMLMGPPLPSKPQRPTGALSSAAT